MFGFFKRSHPVEGEIPKWVAALVKTHDGEAAPGVKPKALAAYEQELGMALPQDVRDFYLTCDGLDCEGVSFCELSELEPLDLGWEMTPLALVDADDSDPLCIIAKGPLAGMVLHLSHDGDTHLRFQSLEEMLRTFAEADSVWDAYEDEMCRSLPPEVEVTGPELLAAYDALLEEGFDEEDDPDGASNRLQIAMDLCGPDQVSRIWRLVARGDEYVRERALERLQEADTEEAQALLKADAEAFAAFVKGLERRGPAEKVRGLNLPMLYAARHEDDFDAWVKRLLE